MSADGNDTQRHPGGRPTDYRPEFCSLVVEYGKNGKSRTWIATELDVHRDTLYAWEKQYPEFSDALARAKQWEQRYYEDAGQGGMYSKDFNASIWSRSMAARFPEDWRERTENDTTLKAGGDLAALLARVATGNVFPKDDNG
jgi:hypothetical protein